MIAQATECLPETVTAPVEAHGDLFVGGAEVLEPEVYAVVDGDIALSEAERYALNCPEINHLEAFSLAHPQVEYPLVNSFVERNNGLASGVYAREVFLPAGVVYTTAIHRTRHFFVVSSGRAKVWTRERGWHELFAPHTGITEPGTRRIILTLEPVVWTTFHPTDEKDPDKIRSEISLTPRLICSNPRLLDVNKIAALLN